jgi:LysR family nitrogen assimilation transcriptional regulator
MELRQLRYLLAVAEEGSITRAAQRVYVTQPALSQQLQLLERELGTALLDRSGRRVRLTPAGEILVRSAREVIRQLEEARTAGRCADGQHVSHAPCAQPLLGVLPKGASACRGAGGR